MKNIAKYAVTVSLLASVLVPMVALAGNLVEPAPPIGSGNALTGTSLTNLLKDIASFILTISVIIAVIFIVWAGIIGITQGWDKAREKLTNAVVGLLIIFGVGLIMQTLASLIDTQSIG